MNRAFITSRGLPGWVFVALLVGVVVVLELGGPLPRIVRWPTERVFITELAATPQADLADEDGDLADWIELANFGTKPLNLEGWYLTDNYHQLAKWRFPAVPLRPGARLVVFASGKDRRNPAGRLHTNFELDDRGEYLALVRPDGRTIAQELLPKFPRQTGRHTFGLRDRLRTILTTAGIPFDAYRYFEHATPGFPNGPELAGVVAPVKASEVSGLFAGPTTVALFTATPGARIHYTTNGTPPDRSHGQLYRQPLRLQANTVVQALAFRPGFASSEVLTRTFLFPSGVPEQTGAGFPSSWGLTNGEPVQAHYTMSSHVTGQPAGREQVVEGLLALPTLALTTTLSNLFDPARGIYANPLEDGQAWERQATVEWLPVDGRRGFQVDGGLRIQGGWNRRPEECPKHSFRLVFRKKYGEPRLRFPLFGPGGAQEFDTLILRGGGNNSWLHWDGAERRRGDYLRDPWMRETQRAMGHAAARGRFAHLYLNGLYWGLYNVTERPNAHFVAANQGGTPEDYDVLAAGEAVSGDTNAWHELMARVNRGVTNHASYLEVGERLDMTAFADFMVLNYYGADGDWDRSSNWYAARRREPPGPFRFFVWDGERTLENVQDNRLDFDDDQSPSRLFHRLEASPLFRRLVADRIRLHCGEGGALSPAAAAERYQRLAEQIEQAIQAESARWGAYRHDVHPYKTGPYERSTVEDHWRPEIQRLLTDYFPRRTAAFVELMRQRGLLEEKTTTP